MEKTIYQIQAFSARWHQWDAEYVSQDTDATNFATLEEAEAMVEELVAEGGRHPAELRIREVVINE